MIFEKKISKRRINDTFVKNLIVFKGSAYDS